MNQARPPPPPPPSASGIRSLPGSKIIWAKRWEIRHLNELPQSSVPQQPTLPNLVSLIMAQNGRVPVFASDDRNVTAAALSTLGGNLVWSEKLAPSPAELLAAVGRG
ncbi:hypothetical protein LEMLEM_LOCUS7397 [Lemmus lemmus]